MPRDSKKKGGLGRGVLSLMPQDEAEDVLTTATETNSKKGGLVELPITNIEPNPNQPRRHF